MEAIQFKRAELEDQEIIAHYFEHHTSAFCTIAHFTGYCLDQR